ncbi:tRNA-dihydrouridine(16/17) synthase [NAD(P)(+)]-like [Panonychus citri]|uniref:tRNA-dihydrouridine(16/17) synthase [NAD(P)(+)]-like n=1 Tax=Panonychus citri TaxID=50023 RepID=UPI0023083638|nr:tRNA-dihydrouridine(16/17) synthase [NAD(P)(+)]-like [Panonychus citri]
MMVDNFWSKSLNSPKFIVGPMVDQSELPFRLLCRSYEAQLCYTPMFHAGIFVKDPKYRKENFVNCENDRPLIVQFCANDPDTFLEAAKLVEPYCDAVDLNLGCPQTIAKRGHYGAFLEDEWDLLKSMISKVSKELTIPVTCKIRIFQDIDKTIRYAQMLEQAGCSMIAVHGRVKEQKGVLTGVANWKYIKAIKESVKIPVIANGNIQSLDDVNRCLKETGVEGIMSAEGVLHNPALFSAIHPPVWKVAEEYLKLVEQYPVVLSIVRGHLFKFFHISLSIEENADLRHLLAKASARPQLHEFVRLMKERYQEKLELDDLDFHVPMTTLPLPPYLCQPHFRPSPPLNKPTGSEETSKKRPIENDSETSKTKRLANEARLQAKKAAKEASGRKLPLCTSCPNPRGVKCDYNLCKTCCRNKVFKLVLDCVGHKLMFKTRKRLAEEKEAIKTKERSTNLNQQSTINNSSTVLTCE